MDRQSAVKIIKDTFENSFDNGRFINLSKNLVKYLDDSKGFTYQGNIIPDAYNQSIQTLERVGKYEDADSNKIDVLIVRLKKERSLEHARTMQRNFVAWYLNGSRGGELKDAALVAFVSPDDRDWRFSLVRMDYNLVESPTGKVKVEKELTPARRYSFLVGESESSHTAQGQLLPILENDERKPLLSDFEKAFSIEVVTREFFTKYRELFHKVEEALRELVDQNERIREDFEAKGVDTVNFAKKLLGQVVFLYFLQKKGWFGVGRDEDWGTGPKDFLRRLFEKKVAPYENFFNDVLEPLFYEALAVDRTAHFYSRFNCKIPFLNGGLFDPINNYDWVHTDILLPNKLFSNDDRTKEGDIGTGILDVFDRYNFTVKEDEPLDKEVAVDPEMLGKVFENLLEVKDRKSKGTYYTPREIVHYMCQESLINYLDTAINTGEVPLVATPPPQGKLFGKPDPEQGALKAPGYRAIVPREDIETLVRIGELAIEHDTRVETTGRETRDYSYKLPPSIRWNAKLIDDKLAGIRVCDPAIGSGAFPVGLMTEIVRARNTLTTYLPDKSGRNNYNFKRHAIQNCLYGVDIDPGAVEIAKLRLWLSLVVDEEDFRQIHPLPNLDYKIVCGNSLLGVEKNLFNVELFNELERLKLLYFNETNVKKKQGYKKQIDQLIKKITNDNETFDFAVYFSEVFHEKGGFDIVIANPPYIDSEAMVKKGQKDLRDFIAKNYQLTKGNWDIYISFFERGFKILNTNGSLTFISPDKWISKPFGFELRKATLGKVCSILRAGRQVFEEAKVDSIVTFFSGISCASLKVFDFEKGQIVFKGEVNKSIISEPFAFDFVFSDYLPLLEKMEAFQGRLIDTFECENACATSDAYTLKPLIQDLCGSDFDPKKHLKIVNTGTIGKYTPKWGKVAMTYLKDKYLCPVVDREKFLSLFNNSYSAKSVKPKIIIKGLTLLHACLDANGNIIPGKSTLIIANESLENLKFLLAILNSNLAFFYIREKYPAASYNQGINFTKEMINNLPTPLVSKEDRHPLISLIDKILAITKDEDYLSNPSKKAKVKELERQIDQLVYRLYGLTEDEIAIVEGKK
jgi:hypothetical protein